MERSHFYLEKPGKIKEFFKNFIFCGNPERTSDEEKNGNRTSAR